MLSCVVYAADETVVKTESGGESAVITEEHKLQSNDERESQILKEQSLQQKVNNIGYRILNANKIDKPIVFTYTVDNRPLLPVDTSVTKRQIMFYDVYFKYASK